jgi:hypothetical protein
VTYEGYISTVFIALRTLLFTCLRVPILNYIQMFTEGDLYKEYGEAREMVLL